MLQCATSSVIIVCSSRLPPCGCSNWFSLSLADQPKVLNKKNHVNCLALGSATSLKDRHWSNAPPQ